MLRLRPPGGAVLARHPAATGGLAFAAIAAVVRIGNYNAPLIGDVTQFLYVGNVVAHGGAPYVDAAFNKGPLTALLFAPISAVSGTSSAVVRASVVPFAAVAALALAGYVAHYAGRIAGAVAGTAYAAFSAIQRLDGAEGKTETYAVAPLLGALWLTTRTERWAAPALGALLGCAILLNPGLVAGAPAVIVALWLATPAGGRRRRLGAATLGLGATFVPVVVWLAAVGALDDMLIQVGGKISSTLGLVGAGPAVSLAAATAVSSPNLLGIPAPALWLPALAGAALALRAPALRPAAAVLGLLAVVTLLRMKLAHPGFDYQDYPAVPALCGEIGLGVAALGTSRARLALAGAALVPALWTLAIHPQLDLLDRAPLDRLPQGREVHAVARFLRGHTRPSDRIIVAGGRAEVYWAAQRRAPTRFFDAFGTARRGAYLRERRHTLMRRPPAAVVIMSTERLTAEPAVKAVVKSGPYVLAYAAYRCRVWLRRG